MKYSNDHAKVLAHLESCSLLVPSTEPEPVLSKTSSVQTSSNDEKLDNPETLPVHVIPKEVKQNPSLAVHWVLNGFLIKKLNA